MFDNRRGEAVVVNWRGLLLAAGIFGAIFAVLLLMAHQNQSNTSDMGSSLRQDPYGTSLLFDSYARAGYRVRRSKDEDSLADVDASSTTAFFIGGFSAGDWRMEGGELRIGEKFRARLEGFIARGGRAVLIAPRWKIKSESQGWEVESKWYHSHRASGPTWISPDPSAMPSGSENMYLAHDAPWLQTDPSWTVLYSAPEDAQARNDSGVHVYMAMRRVGNGELVAASQESFLFNETLKTHPNPELLDFLAGGRPLVWVDETLHGLHQDEGVLWLVRRYRLQAALLLFWATLLVLLWSMSGDLVRRPRRDPGAQVVWNTGSAGVAPRRLLQRSIAAEQVVAECWKEFRRRSPQDAQAITSDPQSDLRLRTALAQHPLDGYRHLSKLIAERRASARGSARSGRRAPKVFTTTPAQEGSEEASIT